MFWKGMFSSEIKKKSALAIREVMSPAPYAIDAGASLMEACYMMLKHKVRRLVVMKGGDVSGIIREQDLFFEMERVLEE
jgi:signal-transduction protein with cAMP-binding, CBS, and nucleotidyltransferase domain